jgi:hypothetical protein
LEFQEEFILLGVLVFTNVIDSEYDENEVRQQTGTTSLKYQGLAKH